MQNSSSLLANINIPAKYMDYGALLKQLLFSYNVSPDKNNEWDSKKSGKFTIYDFH